MFTLYGNFIIEKEKKIIIFFAILTKQNIYSIIHNKKNI